MAKEEIIIKTGAFASDWRVFHNVIDLQMVDGQPVTKYINRISIVFDVKGQNIVRDTETINYDSEPSDVMFTALEATQWAAANILDFIYAGKNDIAGYVPQQ